MRQESTSLKLVRSDQDVNVLLARIGRIFFTTLGFYPTVRLAKDSDSPRVLAFIREIRSHYDIHIPAERETDLVNIQSSYDAKGGFVLIVERGPDILGTFALAPLSQEVGELRKLYLAQSLRALGIGRRVLTLLLKYAQDLGLRRIQAETNSRLDGMYLFKKMGFRPLGKSSSILEHAFLPEEGAVFEYRFESRR